VYDVARHAAIVTRIRFEFDEYALPVEYGRLGGTGLELSSIGLGCGNFGGIGSAPELFGRGESEAEAFAIMDRAEAAGINFFDTAASYGGGRSESWIGNWRNEREAPVLLSTKVYWSVTGDPADRGLSRERILRELDGSLARLQADRVDMYLTHEPDSETPIEETLRALDELVGAGKVGAIGVSNVDGEQLQEALATSDRHGLARFGWVQNEYSLLRREPEREVLPLCAREGLGFTPFSPLCGGWLTGKYQRSQAFPDGSRMALRGEPYSDLVNERTFQGLERFQTAAAERGVEPAELAIAWVSTHPQVTSVIVGPRRPAQLDAALNAAEIRLSEQERDELAELFA
jgi:aryl-alcohol dehydrogenase-like predicted oxidoreductase